MSGRRYIEATWVNEPLVLSNWLPIWDAGTSSRSRIMVWMIVVERGWGLRDELPSCFPPPALLPVLITYVTTSLDRSTPSSRS